MNTVLQNKKQCWKCHKTGYLHEHHIIYGTANRKHSEKYGLKVWLCPEHHNQSRKGVHFDNEFDLELKRLAQSKFEEMYSRDKFMLVFGRNYLE